MKAQDRADLVQTYESVGSVSRRLGDAGRCWGSPPGFDAQASRARQEAPKAELDKLAAAVSPGRATIVVVGPAPRSRRSSSTPAWASRSSGTRRASPSPTPRRRSR